MAIRELIRRRKVAVAGAGGAVVVALAVTVAAMASTGGGHRTDNAGHRVPDAPVSTPSTPDSSVGPSGPASPGAPASPVPGAPTGVPSPVAPPTRVPPPPGPNGPGVIPGADVGGYEKLLSGQYGLQFSGLRGTASGRLKDGRPVSYTVILDQAQPRVVTCVYAPSGSTDDNGAAFASGCAQLQYQGANPAMAGTWASQRVVDAAAIGKPVAQAFGPVAVQLTRTGPAGWTLILRGP
ncbi:MAG: hypothetical protein ACJ73S_14475 [Mycobacteriales bacterium]